MNNNKTLIILTPGFPENESDSTCIPPQQVFTKALKQTHPDLNIIVLAFQYPFVASEYVWQDIRVISFNGRNRGQIKRLILWIKVWNTLRRIKKENNVIGILSFWLGECALVGKYFAARNNLAHYCWILGQDARKNNRYVKLMRAHEEDLIAMSDSLSKEFYKNYGFKPKYTITNGIDTTLYPTSREKSIDVIGVGSLISLKQYELFIEIIHELIPDFPGIKAVICGKGPE
jgi:glycosyltransferase involved in cell wall biosynthesis